MRIRKRLSLLPILLLAVALVACSDDSTSPQPESDILVTFELNEFFMRAFSEQGTVFASDAEGKVLDVATWDGPATVVLRNTEVRPDTISFTFVRARSWELGLATEVGVPVGTVWTYTGSFLPVVSGNAEINFINIPQHEGYMISSYWSGFSAGGQISPNQTIKVYGDSTDCYVRVDLLGASPVGGWLRGIHAEDAVTFDFNAPGAVAPLAATVVQLPPGGDLLTYQVYGLVPSGSFRNLINLELKIIHGMIPETITIFTPSFDPANLNTLFYQSTEGNPDTFYQQESSGPIPGVFTQMEGELFVTSTSPDSLSFLTSFNWDRFTATWYLQNDIHASWFVEGNTPIQEFSLPELPQEISDQFPDYPREDFVLLMLRIIQDGDGAMALSQGIQYPIVALDQSETAPWGGLPRRPSIRMFTSSTE